MRLYPPIFGIGRESIAACDLNGFPNGRRVTDDVVDIELTVAEGALTGANSLQTCDVSGPSPTVRAHPSISAGLTRAPCS